MVGVTESRDLSWRRCSSVPDQGAVVADDEVVQRGGARLRGCLGRRPWQEVSGHWGGAGHGRPKVMVSRRWRASVAKVVAGRVRVVAAQWMAFCAARRQR